MLEHRQGYMRGHNLSPRDREHVLRAFVHRSTGDHRLMYPCGPLQFEDDPDWLRNTYFKVTKKMNIDHRSSHCESYPTWPDNPELRHN
jgi:hypothetical protein